LSQGRGEKKKSGGKNKGKTPRGAFRESLGKSWEVGKHHVKEGQKGLQPLFGRRERVSRSNESGLIHKKTPPEERGAPALKEKEMWSERKENLACRDVPILRERSWRKKKRRE